MSTTNDRIAKLEEQVGSLQTVVVELTLALQYALCNNPARQEEGREAIHAFAEHFRAMGHGENMRAPRPQCPICKGELPPDARVCSLCSLDVKDSRAPAARRMSTQELSGEIQELLAKAHDAIPGGPSHPAVEGIGVALGLVVELTRRAAPPLHDISYKGWASSTLASMRHDDLFDPEVWSKRVSFLASVLRRAHENGERGFPMQGEIPVPDDLREVRK